jgi:hypothetical protein
VFGFSVARGTVPRGAPRIPAAPASTLRRLARDVARLLLRPTNAPNGRREHSAAAVSFLARPAPGSAPLNGTSASGLDRGDAQQAVPFDGRRLELGRRQHRPERHRLECVWIDPTMPQTLYVGMVQDSVYRSRSGVDDWQRRNTGMNADTITKIATVPGSQRVHAVSPGDSDDGRFAGVYVSDNRGDQWSDLTAGLSPQAVHCVAVQGSSGYAFVGTLGGGVFRR